MTLNEEILEGTATAFELLEEIAIAVSEKSDPGSGDYDEEFELTPFTDAIVNATEALGALRELVISPSETERILKIWRKNNAE